MSIASLSWSAAPGGTASGEASPAPFGSPPVKASCREHRLNPSLTLVASPSSQQCLWDERQWLF
jgi:hypothetical protein